MVRTPNYKPDKKRPPPPSDDAAPGRRSSSEQRVRRPCHSRNAKLGGESCDRAALVPVCSGPYLRGLIRYRVSEQQSPEGLAEELAQELLHLAAADPLLCETSLLIHPHVLGDFLDYNQFLDQADDAVAALGLKGELQIASFHPAYQFAGSAPNDIENCSNRSPYPMLHLLREQSVRRAAATFRDVNEIGHRNIATLRELGAAGLRKLLDPEEPSKGEKPRSLQLTNQILRSRFCC